MTRPQITPGDWHLGKRYEAEFGAIYGPKGEEVALPLGFFMEPSEAEANARAIAALPALLEALEQIAHDFRCSDNAELAREVLKDAGYTF